MAGRTGRQMERWEVALIERLRRLPLERAPASLRRRIRAAIAGLDPELEKEANEHETVDHSRDRSIRRPAL